MPTAYHAALYGGSVTPEVVSWRNGIVASGSSVSQATQRAVSNLARSLKAYGLWDKCLMIDPCAGDDITAATYRLKVPSGVAAAYGVVSFLAGDYSETAGITGDGSSKYLNTGINPVTLSYSTSSLMLWSYTRTAVVGTGTTRVSIGNVAGSGTTLGWQNSGSAESVAIARAGVVGELAGAVAPSTTGLLGGGTNGSRVATFYKNGSATGSTATESGSFSNSAFFVHACNNSTTGTATPGQYNNRTLSSNYITTGLSASEASTFYNIVQAYETAMGRNV